MQDLTGKSIGYYPIITKVSKRVFAAMEELLWLFKISRDAVALKAEMSQKKISRISCVFLYLARKSRMGFYNL